MMRSVVFVGTLMFALSFSSICDAGFIFGRHKQNSGCGASKCAPVVACNSLCSQVVNNCSTVVACATPVVECCVTKVVECCKPIVVAPVCPPPVKVAPKCVVRKVIVVKRVVRKAPTSCCPPPPPSCGCGPMMPPPAHRCAIASRLHR